MLPVKRRAAAKPRRNVSWLVLTCAAVVAVFLLSQLTYFHGLSSHNSLAQDEDDKEPERYLEDQQEESTGGANEQALSKAAALAAAAAATDIAAAAVSAERARGSPPKPAAVVADGVRNLTVLFGMIGRDVANKLPYVLPNIERLGCRFAKSHIVFVENDSKDDSVKIFKEWAERVTSRGGSGSGAGNSSSDSSTGGSSSNSSSSSSSSSSNGNSTSGRNGGMGSNSSIGSNIAIGGSNSSSSGSNSSGSNSSGSNSSGSVSANSGSSSSGGPQPPLCGRFGIAEHRVLQNVPSTKKKAYRVLAAARNYYLKALQEPAFSGVDYLIVVDSDMCWPWNVDEMVSVINRLLPSSGDEWHALYANGACAWYLDPEGKKETKVPPWTAGSWPLYCDLAAFRDLQGRQHSLTQSKVWLSPFGDCNIKHGPWSAIRCRYINQEPVMEVAAAFGGWGMYRADVLRPAVVEGVALPVCEYSASTGECEHVALSRCLKEKRFANQVVANRLVVNWMVYKKCLGGIGKD